MAHLHFNHFLAFKKIHFRSCCQRSHDFTQSPLIIYFSQAFVAALRSQLRSWAVMSAWWGAYVIRLGHLQRCVPLHSKLFPQRIPPNHQKGHDSTSDATFPSLPGACSVHFLVPASSACLRLRSCFSTWHSRPFTASRHSCSQAFRVELELFVDLLNPKPITQAIWRTLEMPTGGCQPLPGRLAIGKSYCRRS